MNASTARHALSRLADPAKAKVLQSFFKTGPGQYGEGDVFLGVTMPQVRALARDLKGMPLRECLRLLARGRHEERMLALVLMVGLFERAKDEAGRAAVAKAYLASRRWIDNWDLVDVTCPRILGAWLEGKDCSVLYRLARSKRLWDRRLAMVSTLWFIAKGDARDALKIAALMLKDGHDLMHKASGWMLREVGKRCDVGLLRGFLRRHSATMPRTMLRYAIERLPESERRRWMGVGAGAAGRRGLE